MTSSRITNDELNSFHSSAPLQIQLAIELFVLTGATEAELLNLSWRNIQPELSLIARLKGGQAAGIRMDSTIVNVLERARASRPYLPREYVIRDARGLPYSSVGFRALWVRHMKRWSRTSGTSFALHDLKSRRVS